MPQNATNAATLISIATLIAWSDGRKGRTPGNGPNKSRDKGSRTSCRKKTNRAQFQGQSNFPRQVDKSGREPLD